MAFENNAARKNVRQRDAEASGDGVEIEARQNNHIPTNTGSLYPLF